MRRACPASRLSVTALWWLSACGDEATQPAGPAAADPNAPQVRVISWNVGNGSSEFPRYALRMTDERYAAFVAEKLAPLAVDVFLLQEVLAPNACDGEPETDPRFTCYQADPERPLARQLLGPDYTIACDARKNIECIGVRIGFGTIRGLEPGAFSVAGADTPPLPFPGCDYTGGTCVSRGDLCDIEATISTVMVDSPAVAGGVLRIVHAHPAAIGTRCRTEEVKQAFELLGPEPTLMGGDWNFETDSPTDLIDAATWNQHVGPGQRLTNHHPRDADGVPLPTRFTGRSIDRVATDFAQGVCQVWDEPPLDDGFPLLASGEMVGDRIDHKAVDCTLSIRPEAQP